MSRKVLIHQIHTSCVMNVLQECPILESFVEFGRISLFIFITINHFYDAEPPVAATLLSSSFLLSLCLALSFSISHLSRYLPSTPNNLSFSLLNFSTRCSADSFCNLSALT